jgi:RNA polymerase sigma-70 factor (ECF subfamily)
MPTSHRLQPGDPPISPKSGEDEDLTQPESLEDGVTEDMGTLALHPGIWNRARSRPESAALVATDLTPEQIEARRARLLGEIFPC